jgi:hypothetical protein
VLHFFLEILNSHVLENTLKIHVLRLVGNSCADTGKVNLIPVNILLTFQDENRSRVITSNYLPSIILQLKETSLLPFVIPVLFNICVDYGRTPKLTCRAITNFTRTCSEAGI